MQALGLYPEGVVRASVLHYNTPDDVRRLLAAVAARYLRRKPRRAAVMWCLNSRREGQRRVPARDHGLAHEQWHVHQFVAHDQRHGD